MVETKEVPLLKITVVKKRHIEQMQQINWNWRDSISELINKVERLFWVRYQDDGNTTNKLVVKVRLGNQEYYKTVNLGYWDWSFVLTDIINGIPQVFVD